jgi:hypothetical protein
MRQAPPVRPWSMEPKPPSGRLGKGWRRQERHSRKRATGGPLLPATIMPEQVQRKRVQPLRRRLKAHRLPRLRQLQWNLLPLRRRQRPPPSKRPRLPRPLRVGDHDETAELWLRPGTRGSARAGVEASSPAQAELRPTVIFSSENRQISD